MAFVFGFSCVEACDFVSICGFFESGHASDWSDLLTACDVALSDWSDLPTACDEALSGLFDSVDGEVATSIVLTAGGGLVSDIFAAKFFKN